MAKTTPSKPAHNAGKIVDIDVANEMQDSVVEYAHSVIYSRALPESRDG